LFNGLLALAGAAYIGVTSTAIYTAACGGVKFALLMYIGSRIAFVSAVVYADWKYKQDVRGAEAAYLRRLSLCNLTFEMDWKNYLCP
jgi:hypothetical protein